jgi:D-beta-D-heptose 7-phosphate kinase/D-beta-D-heptose 1-phosphate adenosyltransferase
MHDLDLGALLVTRGEHGMTLLRPDHPALHLPARAREVFDVTGAGDTVISTLAAAIAAGEELPHAVALANLARASWSASWVRPSAPGTAPRHPA